MRKIKILLFAGLLALNVTFLNPVTASSSNVIFSAAVSAATNQPCKNGTAGKICKQNYKKVNKINKSRRRRRRRRRRRIRSRRGRRGGTVIRAPKSPYPCGSNADGSTMMCK